MRAEEMLDNILWGIVYLVAACAACLALGAVLWSLFILSAKPAPAATSATFANELPVSCTVIRWFAIQFPPEQLEALARRYRLTPEQRRQAIACLKMEDDK